MSEETDEGFEKLFGHVIMLERTPGIDDLDPFTPQIKEMK